MNNPRRLIINNAIQKLRDALDAALSNLEQVRDEEQEAFDNMPEGLQGSEKGEKAEECVGALDSAVDACTTLSDMLNDLEATIS